MKINRMFTISMENFEKLKLEDNKSGLVDSLLSRYFNRALSADEIKLQIKKMEIMQNAQDKIKELSSQ